MGQRKDVSDFDKGQMASAGIRRLGQSISRTAALVGCSRSAVVRTYQKWSKEGKPVNRRQGQTRGSLMHVGSEGWPVLSGPIEELLELKLLKKLMLVLIERCQNTQCISVCCCMGLRSRRPVRVPMLTRVHLQKRLQWAREHQNWTMEQWKKVARSDESRFLLHHVYGNELEVLTRPPNSPDLNPMEHLWDVLDKQVRSTEAPPRNLQDLKDLLLTAWCQIPQQTFRGLGESMPPRVRAVLAAKGGPTEF